jgi:hypothetical protein
MEVLYKLAVEKFKNIKPASAINRMFLKSFVPAFEHNLSQTFRT